MGTFLATSLSGQQGNKPGTSSPPQASYDQDGGGRELDFQQVADEFYAPLYRFAMSLTRSESDACDLVQDTFLTWASKGSQLRQPERVKGWLFTTLHRKFLQGQRRTTRFPHQEIEEAAPDLPIVEPGIVSRLDAQGAVRLLAELDPPFRAAVALFYLEDYSYEEIGRVLEIPLGTVKSRIARGLAQLKSRMLRDEPRGGRES